LSAVSTASDPELEKNVWSRSPGIISARTVASSKLDGCPIWKAVA
jgi:hypothetical protein